MVAATTDVRIVPPSAPIWLHQMRGSGQLIQMMSCLKPVSYRAFRHASRGIEYHHLHVGDFANQIVHHGIAMIEYSFADYPAAFFALNLAAAFVPKLVGMVIHI